MKLFGPPTTNLGTVIDGLENLDATALFRDVITIEVWSAALEYHIDPIGMVAQSFKETGAGRFGGKIDRRWCNPCGLKVRDQSIHPELMGDKPLAHAMFPNWRVGAVAQAQHLRAYGNWPVPANDLIVDPRYEWVIGRHRVGEFWQLGGKWAPSSEYGIEIEDIARRIVEAGR